jgi:hypothetical protein
MAIELSFFLRGERDRQERLSGRAELGWQGRSLHHPGSERCCRMTPMHSLSAPSSESPQPNGRNDTAP